ncbi:F0F1 ATP synthase subunit A [Candidatus Berkelbacteria bacterium]|nr:F0F1 ATP synthase subunit A [Candidatus Berkelbacteria bacterium]
MHEISLASEKLFSLGPIVVTNSILATWLGIFTLVSLAFLATRRIALIPNGFQNVAEGIIEILLDLIEQVTQDRRRAEQLLPFLATFFLFILTLNWMELIPGFGSLVLYTNTGEAPLLRSANTDLNTPLALALISVLGTQILGIIALGFFKHVRHYLSFKPTLEGAIGFFVGFLHIIGEVARVISFTFRLFGNIFAGEVLLVVIAFLIPYVVPVPFYVIELLVGFIQALVFMMLTLVFIVTATADTHSEAH